MDMDLLDVNDGDPRMLIADDDPSIVRVLADRCIRMGFDVDTATNGLQAMMKASHGKLDVLVIDINMPGADGLSVCAHLSRRDRRPRHTVVVTASRDPETIRRCESIGAVLAHKGANFWSDLEFALAEIYPEMEGQIRRAGMRAPAGVSDRPLVLLVDDDQDVRQLLARELESRGAEVLCASDALEAYRTACREVPAVIVADYFMPTGDAQCLLTRLRSAYATENIPVIVLSGRHVGEATARVLQREICSHPGAARVLKKSSDLSELLEALRPYCDLRDAPDGGLRH